MHSLMWGYNAAISALGKAKQMEGVKDLLATMRASGTSELYVLVPAHFGQFVFERDVKWSRSERAKGQML